MSEVAEPPAIQVMGRVGFFPRMSTAWGTVGTMSEALRTTTWVSGTSEIARRPWSGSPSRTMVPEMEIATRQRVTTASISSSSSVGMACSRLSSRTVRPSRARPS